MLHVKIDFQIRKICKTDGDSAEKCIMQFDRIMKEMNDLDIVVGKPRMKPVSYTLAGKELNQTVLSWDCCASMKDLNDLISRWDKCDLNPMSHYYLHVKSPLYG